LAAETQEFLTMTICPVYQGYGLTEVCGLLCAQPAGAPSTFGNVGVPCPCAEIKLVESGSYKPNPLGNKLASGEIWVRGHSVMKGYYKQDSITKEALSDDGWFMTGDIGQWNRDGTLSIIDRKKNLVKLSHGEYIALEKLEAQYRTSKYVMNMCVIADPSKSIIVALIVPVKDALRPIMNENMISSDQINHQKVVDAIANDLMECAKKAKFKGAEILRNFKLVEEEWTPQNSMLTSAQKLNRKQILASFSREIDELYG
jgi:long-chain acyl-CoA synthetase